MRIGIKTKNRLSSASSTISTGAAGSEKFRVTSFPSISVIISSKYLELKGAIERVSAIAVSEETKSRGLKLIIENNKLQLLANSASKGSAIEELDVQFAHDKLEIGFNSRYLLDIISEIDGTDVTLNFSDPAAPVLIIDDAEDNLFFVLMPMRI